MKMNKKLIVVLATTIQFVSVNAFARTEYCHNVLNGYRDNIAKKIQSDKEKGTEPSFETQMLSKKLESENPDVEYTLIKSGEDGWVTINISKMSTYDAFRIDCIKSTINIVCPQGWNVMSNGNIYQGADIQCKGW